MHQPHWSHLPQTGHIVSHTPASYSQKWLTYKMMLNENTVPYALNTNCACQVEVIERILSSHQHRTHVAAVRRAERVPSELPGVAFW